MLFELGVAELTSDAAGASRHLSQAVALLGDVAERPEIVLAYSHALFLADRGNDAMDVLQRTSDRIHDVDRDLHFRLEARLIFGTQYEPALQQLRTERLQVLQVNELGVGTGASMLLAEMAFEAARHGVSRRQAVDCAIRALASGNFAETDELLFVLSALYALMLAGELSEAGQGFSSRRVGGSGWQLAVPNWRWQDFLEAGRIAESLTIENPALSPWRAYAALTLRRLDRQNEARELAAAELQLSRRWGAPRSVGISLRALGLVEIGRSGEQLLREAVAVLAGSPARLEHARAIIDLGANLRRGNSRTEARRLLREGIELAHQCGAGALVKRGNEELAAAGGHPLGILLSGTESLTPSERRVAHIAAEGASNKEIAQALFVTVKTVEMHLGRVYRKLDIGSRGELSAALASRVAAPEPR